MGGEYAQNTCSCPIESSFGNLCPSVLFPTEMQLIEDLVILLSPRLRQCARRAANAFSPGLRLCHCFNDNFDLLAVGHAGIIGQFNGPAMDDPLNDSAHHCFL